MATVVRITRQIVQTKEFELELKGKDEGEIDDALADHIYKKENDYLIEDDRTWDLEDISVTDSEIIEYPDFGEEE